jgi:glycosyltransferase involved in cell wall biosynthesis
MRESPDPAKRAAVILPALNEERGLRTTLSALARQAPGVRVVVVDDGSVDATASVAQSGGAKLVRHAARRGKGAAIRSGLAATDADFVVVMDADATYPADAVLPMLTLLAGGHDYVSGVRDSGRRHIPLVNRVGNALLGTAIRRLSGSSLRDPLTGMYAFRRGALAGIQPSEDGFAIETELAIRSARAGLRTGEVPIAYAVREGESKLRPIRDGWQIGTVLLALTLDAWRLRRRRTVE